MVPAFVIVLSELPLTANGKLDRAALPTPGDIETEVFIPPRAGIEEKIAAIWSSVLRRHRIGRHDNFFAIGGDSILSIRIVARAREAGLLFTVRDLFRFQTLAELAPRVAYGAPTPTPVATKPGELFPLVPIQCWFFAQNLPEPWHFNLTVLLHLRRSVPISLMHQVLRKILEQHGALRLRFVETNNGFMQTCAAEYEVVPLHEEDLRDLPRAEQPAALSDRASHWQRSLDLKAGPLMRAVLFSLADGQRLLWCVHHLCIDVVSWRILLQDLELALVAAERGETPQWPEASAPFSAWSHYLSELAESPDLLKEGEHWSKLREELPLPVDFSPVVPPVLASAAQSSFRLNAVETRALLEETPVAYRIPFNELLLTAFAIALADWTGYRRVLLDLEGHGRLERDGAPDVSRTVGWFTSIYPVEIVLPETDEFTACISAVKKHLRAVPVEGAGYGLLSNRVLSVLPHRPPSQVAFNYLGQIPSVEDGGLLAFARESPGESRSPIGPPMYPINVDASISGGELEVAIGYSTQQFRRETIERLSAGFCGTLQALLAHWSDSNTAGYTPSDFQLTQETEFWETAVELVPLNANQLWFFRHHSGSVHHFNQAMLLQPSRNLNASTLRSALEAVWRHHDALRATFRTGDGGMEQVFTPPGPFTGFHVRDLRLQEDARAAVRDMIENEHAGFDLAKGPLFKAVLFRLPAGERLLLVAHHLIVDDVSWRILLEDLAAGYARAEAGLPIMLDGDSASARAWAERAFDMVQQVEIDHWRAVLAECVPPSSASPKWGEARAVTQRLAPELTRALSIDAHRAYATDTQDLLVAAVANSLARWDGARRHVIMLEADGRDNPLRPFNLSRTVGWLTSRFPILVQAQVDPRQVIRLTKEMLRRVPSKGGNFLTASEIGEARLPEQRPTIGFKYFSLFGDIGVDGHALFAFAPEGSGTPIAAELTRCHTIDIGAMVVDDAMDLSVVYDPRLHDGGQVERLLDCLVGELQALADHCLDCQASERTPADLLAGDVFDLNSYDVFLAAGGWFASEIEDVWPLSPLQEGLLFHAQLDPDPTSYAVQIAFTVQGAIQTSSLGEAWHGLVARHAALRTVFVHRDVPRQLQVVLRHPLPELHLKNWTGVSPDEQLRRDSELRTADLARGFDLEREPAARCSVIVLGADRYRVIMTFHHIIVDGWSLGCLHREWVALLHGESVLQVAPSFADYLRWLQQCPAGANEYWREVLAGYETIATLPRVKRAETGLPYALGSVRLELDAAVSAGLRSLAAREGATLGIAVLALWAVVLARYNSTDDVVFGCVMSGRPAALPGVDAMVGLFINTVPVRVRIPDGSSFGELLRAMQQNWLAGEPHHPHPLAEILSGSPLGRATFDHLLTIENYPFDERIVEAAGLAISDLAVHDRTHYNFFIIASLGKTISFSFNYNTNVYECGQLERLASHVAALARAVAASPEDALQSLDILPEWERTQVLWGWNATTVANTAKIDLVSVLESRALSMPDAVAVRFGTETLSFAELDARASGIAAFLATLAGMTPDVRIGVCMDRSDRLVVALWGILKAGAAFVPLDPAHPKDRLCFIVQDAGCPVVITDRRHAPIFADLPSLQVVDASALPHSSTDPSIQRHGPQSLAYVMYTSGTTGVPKGVMVEHRNLAHYIAWAARYYYRGGDGGSCGLYSPISFDLTITSLFLPVYCGRTLHVFPQDADAEQLLVASLDPALCIDTIKLTPSHIDLLRHMTVPLTGVRVAIVGGEALHADQVATLERLNPGMAIYNEYGPTEATVGCIVKKVRSNDSEILIGRPIDDTVIYILDHRMRPVPICVPGEIYIGGSGVARGYLNQPELTVDRFVASPFRYGERLFRTGDLARWLPDGEIVLLGRNDDQVKIRGHRIECAEVEACLLAHPAVSKACVVASGNRPGPQELVAYVVSKLGEAVFPQLCCHMRVRLPDYMIPAAFVSLEDLPLTANGKVDRRQLPPPVPVGEARQREPMTTEERRLASIWSSVLGRPDIGVDEGFFDIGGHSLRAVQIVSRIRDEIGLQISLRDFLDHPTIRAQALLLQSSEAAALDIIPPAPPRSHYLLSHAQKRLYLVSRFNGADVAYNMPKAYLFHEPIHRTALIRALQALVARHESLRTGFVEIDDEPRQFVRPDASLAVEIHDFADWEPDSAEKKARALADSLASAIFDLTAPPLLRAAFVSMPQQRSLLVLVLHHIIGDGWSMTILYEEILSLYVAFRSGRHARLKPLTLQYKDFAVWQNARSFSQEEGYWRERLAVLPVELRLPCDVPPAAVRRFAGSTVRRLLPGASRNRLAALGARRGTGLSDVMLALFVLYLYQITRQDDLCLGLAIANRSRRDTERIVGFFVNLLPVRFVLWPELAFEDLLAQVTKETRVASEHQDYPFDLLVERFNPPRLGNRTPLFNVVYAYQSFADLRIGAAEGRVRPDDPGTEILAWSDFPLSFGTAKFDWTLFVMDNGDAGIELALEYDADLFGAATPERCLAALERFGDMVSKMRADEGESNEGG
jgi:amino acid adenylation domain-containing protein/non-ribosomal peptide synthase protein (TIGR01720 family)